MLVSIIDYQSGNLHSARKAFERAARENNVNVRIEVTSDAKTVLQSDRIVLPGVGAFGDCYVGLSQTPDMLDALKEAVLEKGRPFFGICVGMQLLAEMGFEHGSHRGLGWIKGDVVQIRPNLSSLKIPHMGWNTLNLQYPHPLFEGIPTGEAGWHAYFVHSYHFSVRDREDIVAETNYGGAFTAFVAKHNVAGSQFHPEKSQKLGLRLISNFFRWKP